MGKKAVAETAPEKRRPSGTQVGFGVGQALGETSPIEVSAFHRSHRVVRRDAGRRMIR